MRGREEPMPYMPHTQSIDSTPEIRELEDAVKDFASEPVYAIQHPDGRFVRTSAGEVKWFSSAARAYAHRETLPVNCYKIVRYS
jgi:hypothetical protein